MVTKAKLSKEHAQWREQWPDDYGSCAACTSSKAREKHKNCGECEWSTVNKPELPYYYEYCTGWEPSEEFLPEPKTKEIKMPEEKNYPSLEQDEAFVGAFEYLNEELFDNELPVPMLVLTRNPKIRAGHFAPGSWTADDGSEQDEIALNANVYAEGDWVYAMTVLTHEMIHLEQWVKKNQGRPGYHNNEFCERMKALGILPVNPDTGEEIKNGDRCSDKLIEGGKLEQALKEMPLEYVFPYLPKEFPDDGTRVIVVEKDSEPRSEPKTPPKRGVKIKYSCAVCGNNVWGKGDMVMRCEGVGDRWHEPRLFVEQN